MLVLQDESMNANERMFYNRMTKQGHTLVFTPRRFDLGVTTYTPDFYCPQLDTWFEVVASHRAYQLNRKKYLVFRRRHPHLRFKLVCVDGSRYMEKRLLPETNGQPLKDPGAMALGRKGGHRRALNMTAEQRAEAARRASLARWTKKKP